MLLLVKNGTGESSESDRLAWQEIGREPGRERIAVTAVYLGS
jgi:hypothetical protein